MDTNRLRARARCGLGAAGLLLFVAAPVPAQLCQVEVPVSIVAAATAPPAFSAADLRLERPGHGAVIAVRPAPPHRVLLLLDTSGSMGEVTAGRTVSPIWPLVRGAGRSIWSATLADAEELLRDLPAGSEVGVASFGRHLRWIAPYQAPPPRCGPPLAQAWSSLQPAGKTSFYDALLALLDGPGGLQPGDAIVALSDGADNSSQATAAATRRRLLQRGVRLFLLLHASRDAGYWNHDSEQMARATGGAYVEAGPDVGGASAVARLLTAQLQVTFKVGPGHGRLELGAAARLRGSRLLYPQRQIACPPKADKR